MRIYSIIHFSIPVAGHSKKMLVMNDQGIEKTVVVVDNKLIAGNELTINERFVIYRENVNGQQAEEFAMFEDVVHRNPTMMRDARRKARIDQIEKQSSPLPHEVEEEDE